MQTDALQWTQQALGLVLLLSAPPVIVAAVVGLVIAIVQAATQIQEQTVQHAAKFAAIAVTLFLCASFFGASLLQFTDRILSGFPGMVR